MQAQHIQKPLLGVDIDNVISQTDTKIREIIKCLYGISLTQTHIIHFDYHKCGVNKEQEKEIFSLFNTSECEKLKVIPGSAEALSILRNTYTVILVTSRNPSIEQKTEEWLHTKRIHYDELIFNDRKHDVDVNFDYFVEDCWEYSIKLAEKGIKVILYDYPWNRNKGASPNIIRLKNWNEILSFLT